MDSKTLVRRLGVVGLLPALLSLTACSGADADPNTGHEVRASAEPSTRSDTPFILPYSVSTQPAAAQSAYLSSLDDQQFAVLVENARVTKFITTHLDAALLQEVMAMLPELDVLTADDVRPYLTDAQFAELGTYQLDAEDTVIYKGIGCGSWHTVHTQIIYCETQYVGSSVQQVCKQCHDLERSCWFSTEKRTSCYFAYH